MSDAQKQDAVNEAVAVLSCLQDLLCGGGDEVQLSADGLYQVLGCVLQKLRLAT